MTTKAKAESIVRRFIYLTPVEYDINMSPKQVNDIAEADLKLCKKCSLICVDEILSFIEDDREAFSWKTYYSEVKQEIEKL
jgi:hypothetical protein